MQHFNYNCLRKYIKKTKILVNTMFYKTSLSVHKKNLKHREKKIELKVKNKTEKQ